ncbi:DUF6090 family protein [Maribellus mangrovi]|uniref:DUF6090 family protein n=1 Tax=Maribellus mangrovi TaxID=3133146 RepID=UPI0030EBEF42
MLKILRKIRAALLAEGKTGKYLKYAIGEILLVVIGILIALQVNNWNEGRKSKSQEITILKNIKEDINLDTLDLTFNYEYHKKFYEAEAAFLELLMSEEMSEVSKNRVNFNDALGTKLWTVLHKSTFTNLQNNDVNLLKNNEIRKEISRFYDFFHEAIEQMANQFVEFRLYEKKLPYFKKYFKVIPETYKLLQIEGEPDYLDHKMDKYKIELKDLEGARNDDAFIFTMNEILFLRRAFIDFHESILLEISSLNKHLDEEILKLEKSL